MTLLPSPRRDRARLVLALAALGAAVTVPGAAAKDPHTQGKAPDPPSHAPDSPKAQDPAEPNHDPKSVAQATPVPQAGEKSRRDKRTPSPAKAEPGRQKSAATKEVSPKPETSPEVSEPPTAVPSEVAPEAPAAAPPAEPAPAPETETEPAPRVRQRRTVSSEGSISPRRRGGPAGRATPSASVADVAAEAAETVDTRFDTVNAGEGLPAEEPEEDAESGSPVTRTVEQIVEVVPESVEIALAGLLALSLVLAGASLLSAARARRLDRQRQELLKEVGLLQGALLPPVPEQLGSLHTSVAYRPAEGPGAGGDFYDALPLSDGRVAFILGDVSGHGRAALGRTAFLRYTLRAYLEAGLEPRAALQVGGRVIDQHLSGDFATAVLAVHDPADASLTFACAGHPAPIVVGPSRYGPVLPGASPPLGIGLRTGLRQTTIPLAPGSVACLFTDGLTEARTERGILGRPRLGDILEEIGRHATATDLLERVAAEARLVTDDMAAVLLSPTGGVTAGGFRREELELSADELGTNLARRFLEACAVDGEEAARAELEVAEVSRRHGGAVLSVSFGTGRPAVSVLPRNVESIELSSRRSAAGAGAS